MTSRLLNRALTTALLLAATLVAGLPAGAPAAQASGSPIPALTWGAPIRLANDGNTGQTRSVACPSATQCTATDNYGREVAFDPTNPGTPTPFMLDPAQTLVAVRCPSTTQCVEISSSGRVAMFDPTAPVIPTPTVIDSGAGVGVTGLACPTTSQCTAIDNMGRVATFDPSAPGTPALVTIDSGKQLIDVSCPTSTQCSADDNGGNELTFNPTAPGSPSPVSINGTTALAGISCPTTTQCTAVSGASTITFNPTNPGAPTPGTADSGHSMGRLSCPTTSRCVATDNAQREVTFDPANPAGAVATSVGTGASVTGIACSSANQCTTVDLFGRESTFDPGAPGTITPILVDTRRPIQHLSCPASDQCTATDDNSRAFTFNPAAPATATLTLPSTATGIACPSSTQCTDVSGTNELTFNPMSPGTLTPVSVNSNPLTSVACASTTQCAAVDNKGDRVYFNPASPSPQPVSVDCCSQSLSSVDCPSTGQCTAVDNTGQYVTFHPADGLGPYTPIPIDSGHALTVVVCPSTGQCTALEQGSGNQVTFAPTSPSNPTVRTIDSGQQLMSIACMSTTFCVAVDQLGRALEGDPTSANAWIVQPIPQAAYLQAISCPTSWECVATDALGNAYLGLALPVNTSLPTISGTTTQGQMLTETNGAWTNSPTGFGYQWEDCDSGGNNCTPIGGATASTYTLQNGDAGHKVRVVETATNAAGSGTPATSAATAVVLPLPPGNISPPTISGTDRQGQLLTETHGTWTNGPTSYGYQWEGCDGAGNNCTPIGGATNSTYTLQASDVGHTVRVKEVATNAGGTSSQVPSAVTAVVAPPDTTAPSLQLTATPANPSNSAAAEFAFTGSDVDSPPVTFTCKLDGGAAVPCTSPYDVSGLAQGTHAVTVTAVDAANNSTPANYQWLVDTTAPTVQLIATPANPTSSSAAMFAFTGGDALSPPVSFSCQLDAAAAAPCASPSNVSGLADGSHTFTVTATDGAGNAAHASYPWVVDTTAPTVQFTGMPGNPSNSGAAAFTFTGADAGSGGVTYSCQLDAAASVACGSPYNVTGLTDGTHTFAVTATDAAGNSAGATHQWAVDMTAPSAVLHMPTAPFVLTSPTSLSWSGADTGSGVANYQVRYQRAAWNGQMGPWTYPSGWQALTALNLSVPLPVGYTYCFAVRAVDSAGNASPWTAARCTARALDDRALSMSAGWLHKKATGFYLGTFTQTMAHNATVALKGVRLDRVGIVATTCATCGTLGVYVGSTLIGKINLQSAKTKHEVLRMLPVFALRLGLVTLKVLTTGKLVQIDALAVSER